MTRNSPKQSAWSSMTNYRQLCFFILHSGYTNHGPACGRGIVIPKPASPVTLIETVGELLR